MEKNNEQENVLNLFIEPDCIAEALQDYLEKVEVIAPNRRIVSMNIPIAVDDDGNVPIIIELSNGKNEGMN